MVYASTNYGNTRWGRTMSFFLIVCGLVYLVLATLLVLALCVSARRRDEPEDISLLSRRPVLRTARPTETH